MIGPGLQPREFIVPVAQAFIPRLDQVRYTAIGVSGGTGPYSISTDNADKVWLSQWYYDQSGVLTKDEAHCLLGLRPAYACWEGQIAITITDGCDIVETRLMDAALADPDYEQYGQQDWPYYLEGYASGLIPTVTVSQALPEHLTAAVEIDGASVHIQVVGPESVCQTYEAYSGQIGLTDACGRSLSIPVVCPARTAPSALQWSLDDARFGDVIPVWPWSDYVADVGAAGYAAGVICPHEVFWPRPGPEADVYSPAVADLVKCFVSTFNNGLPARTFSAFGGYSPYQVLFLPEGSATVRTVSWATVDALEALYQYQITQQAAFYEFVGEPYPMGSGGDETLTYTEDIRTSLYGSMAITHSYTASTVWTEYGPFTYPDGSARNYDITHNQQLTVSGNMGRLRVLDNCGAAVERDVFLPLRWQVEFINEFVALG